MCILAPLVLNDTDWLESKLSLGNDRNLSLNSRTLFSTVKTFDLAQILMELMKVISTQAVFPVNAEYIVCNSCGRSVEAWRNVNTHTYSPLSTTAIAKGKGTKCLRTNAVIVGQKLFEGAVITIQW